MKEKNDDYSNVFFRLDFLSQCCTAVDNVLY